MFFFVLQIEDEQETKDNKVNYAEFKPADWYSKSAKTMSAKKLAGQIELIFQECRAFAILRNKFKRREQDEEVTAE